MPTSLIIVDDFLDNPHGLRQAALRLTYPPGENMFPGRNSIERINIEGLAEQVSRIVGEPLQPMPPTQAHGKCRVTLASDRGRAKVHVDAAHWSGILYLSQPEDCRGGTEFFRHLPTGSERAAYSNEEARALGFPSAREMTTSILEQDSMDDGKWEMTMRVPMRFNRLLLLRPWLWHTAGETFGDRIENARLVYLMFFASAARA